MLRAVLHQPAGVSEGKWHQVGGVKAGTQAARDACPLPKAGNPVWPAILGVQKRGHRVPGVGFQLGRRGVVPGDNQGIRVQGQDARQKLIDLFDDVDLSLKIAVFAVAVSFLMCTKKKSYLSQFVPTW